MKIIDILDKIKELPSVIGFENEKILITEILQLDDDEIICNRDLFKDIIKQLELSHTDNGIFFIDDSNYEFFNQFSIWLREKNNVLSLNIANPLIESFSTLFS